MAHVRREKWIGKAIKRKGALRRKAALADESVGEFVSHVLAKGSKASARTKRQANLAKTLKSFNRRK